METFLQVQIFIDKDELKGVQPLYEFIMQFLANHKIAGATAFKGQIGFGGNLHVKRPHDWFSFDEVPMVITAIDREERIHEVIGALREHWKGGLIVTHKVERW